MHLRYIYYYIILQECEDVQSEKCEEKVVQIPKQIKEHKKKCLLSDDATLPSEATTTAYIDPNDPYPVTTESASLDDSIYSGNENEFVARLGEVILHFIFL